MLLFIYYIRYIAVILDNLEYASKSDEHGNVTAEAFDAFYDAWQKFDPSATQFIRAESIKDLLASLDAPLGYPNASDIDVADLAIPLHTDMQNPQLPSVAHCADILDMRVQYIFGAHSRNNNQQINPQLRVLMDGKLRERFPERHDRGPASSDTQEFYRSTQAAKAIQNAWHSRVKFKPMEQVVYNVHKV